jgi:hypothetical protein
MDMIMGIGGFFFTACVWGAFIYMIKKVVDISRTVERIEVELQKRSGS